MRVALLLSLLYLPGCGVLAFDVEQDIREQRVPGNPLGGLLPSFLDAPVPLNIDLRAETQKRDTGPATSANLKSISFSATGGGNFDFLDEIHISVDSPGDASLPKKEVASLKPVPKGQTTIELRVNADVDLLPYINKGAQISASASGRQPTMDFTYTGHVVITVHI